MGIHLETPDHSYFQHHLFSKFPGIKILSNCSCGFIYWWLKSTSTYKMLKCLDTQMFGSWNNSVCPGLEFYYYYYYLLLLLFSKKETKFRTFFMFLRFVCLFVCFLGTISLPNLTCSSFTKLAQTNVLPLKWFLILKHRYIYCNDTFNHVEWIRIIQQSPYMVWIDTIFETILKTSQLFLTLC